MRELNEDPGVPSERHLQDNLATIQTILDNSLANTNFALRKSLDDPLALNFNATVPLSCDTLTLQMNFDLLRGLSTIELLYLTAVTGSESVSLDCLPLKTWKSLVSMFLYFSSDLVSSQVGARIVGTCAGKTYNQPLTVTVKSASNTLSGNSNMEGTLGTVSSIVKTTVLGRLALDSRVSSTVSLIPSELSAYNTTIVSQLESAFRSQLVNVVIPHIQKKLEEKSTSRVFGAIASVVGFVPNLIYTFAGSLVSASGNVSASGTDAAGLEDELYNGVEGDDGGV